MFDLEKAINHNEHDARTGTCTGQGNCMNILSLPFKGYRMHATRPSFRA